MTLDELADNIREEADIVGTDANIAARTALETISEGLYEIFDTLPVNDYESFTDVVEGLSDKLKSLANG